MPALLLPNSHFTSLNPQELARKQVAEAELQGRLLLEQERAEREDEVSELTHKLQRLEDKHSKLTRDSDKMKNLLSTQLQRTYDKYTFSHTRNLAQRPIHPVTGPLTYQIASDAHV